MKHAPFKSGGAFGLLRQQAPLKSREEFGLPMQHLAFKSGALFSLPIQKAPINFIGAPSNTRRGGHEADRNLNLLIR